MDLPRLAIVTARGPAAAWAPGPGPLPVTPGNVPDHAPGPAFGPDRWVAGPGPVVGPPGPAAPPFDNGLPGLLGRLPPPEHVERRYWLVPLCIVVGIAAAIWFARSVMTLARRARPVAAGPD